MSRLVALILLLPGCFVLQFAGTHKWRISEETVETRTSSTSADVSDSQCYVDHRIRVTTKNRISHNFRVAALGEILGGGLGALLGPPIEYGGLAILTDGLLTAFFLAVRDNHTSTTTSWEQSNEVAPCKK